MSSQPLPARILVPVANPGNAEELIRLGSALLEPRTGELTALGLAIATCYFQDGLRLQWASALLTYAATIASFLGAIHWGLAMRAQQVSEPAIAVWLWGVIPCLLAWVALLIPLGAGLWSLAVLLWACYGVDSQAYPRLGVQEWLSMRLVLTQVASACCAIGALAV